MFGPMNYVRRTRIMPALSKLESNQWKSQKECAVISWTNVKAVLHYAYNSVPYYRNLWKSLRISPEDIRLPKDFRKIPVLTKNDIRANFAHMRSTVPRIGVFSNSTGGFTGQPVKSASGPRSCNLRFREPNTLSESHGMGHWRKICVHLGRGKRLSPREDPESSGSNFSQGSLAQCFPHDRK